MKKQNKLQKYLIKQVRRNERRMTTKKAKKAQAIIGLTILVILILSHVITTAQTALQPTILTFENKPLSWDARGSQENTDVMSERTDQYGALVEGSIEEKIAIVFPENPKLMVAVAKAESGLNPLTVHKNTNGSRDIGIMQINSVHGEDDLEMMDVDKNLAVARKVYEKQGITAWAAFSNGSYKKFLND